MEGAVGEGKRDGERKKGKEKKQRESERKRERKEGKETHREREGRERQSKDGSERRTLTARPGME